MAQLAAMDKGSVANLGIGTGSKTESGLGELQEKEPQVVDLIGAPGRSRTCDPRLRRDQAQSIELEPGFSLTEANVQLCGT